MDLPKVLARPSVNKFKETTSDVNAKAGPTTVIGDIKIKLRLSFIILPHSGNGGLMPNPKYPKDPIKIGAKPALIANSTNKVPDVLGNISLQIIENAFSPHPPPDLQVSILYHTWSTQYLPY